VKTLLIAAALLAAAATTAAAEPKKITLEEAIDLATAGNIQIELGKETVVAGEAKVRGTRKLRLPSLSVGGNIFLWNEEIVFPQVDPMTGEMFNIVVREQVTWSAEVSVAQPITGALLLGTLIDFEKAAVSASRAELDTTRLDVAYQTAEAYITVLQLGTLREVAQTSVTQLQANLKQAQALKDAGILFDVDLLRIEAQIAALEQQVLEAEAGAETAKRGLALLLGLPDGTELELAPVDTAPLPLPWTEDDAVARAKAQRPEAKAADARIQQAEKGVDLAKGEYLPMFNAVGNYTHSEGQGIFAVKDSAFLGVTLQWNIWDWGNRRAKLDEAKSGARIAKKARAFVDDQVALDVRSKWLTATTKRKTLDVAESGLKAAEEAHRLQNVRFAGGAGTTTDVIDAEAEVSRARSQATIARYQYLVSWMALVRAVGELPDMPRSP
jgi:OMF family outer membrane factor